MLQVHAPPNAIPNSTSPRRVLPRYIACIPAPLFLLRPQFTPPICFASFVRSKRQELHNLFFPTERLSRYCKEQFKLQQNASKRDSPSFDLIANKVYDALVFAKHWPKSSWWLTLTWSCDRQQDATGSMYDNEAAFDFATLSFFNQETYIWLWSQSWLSSKTAFFGYFALICKTWLQW